MTRALAAALMMLAVGCAARAPLVDRALVRNATSAPISKVAVLHQPGGGGGSVSKILPAADLDLGFSVRELQGERGVVTWSDARRSEHRVVVELPRAPKGASGQTFTLIYTIWPDGVVTAELEP